jgi:hypothetical protein
MKKIVTIVIFCAALTSAYSQADSSKTGTKVIFFGANRNKEAKVYNGNAIKFGLMDVASGLYGLHYERELSEIFSIQAGGGLTGRNYVEFGVNEALTDLSSQKYNNTYSGTFQSGYNTAKDIGDDNNSFDNRTSNMGYFIEIQPKLFLSEDGFDGSYFGLNFQYRHYAFSASNIIPTIVSTNSEPDLSSVTYTTSSPLSEYQNETIIAVSFGHQWTGDKTIVEESISVGLRNISGERRDAFELSNSALSTSYPVAQLSPVSSSGFYFDFTLKIGLWWANKK